MKYLLIPIIAVLLFTGYSFINRSVKNLKGDPQGLPVGTAAPDFNISDQDDEPFALKDALKDGPVVLIFYRGHWCPICNRHLSALQDSLSLITDKGATVIAISPQKSEFLRRTQEKVHAGFRLLSDTDHAVAQAYGVNFEPSATERGMYNTMLGADFKQSHEDGEAEVQLPVPATYVIGKDGHVKWRHFDPDYKKRAQIKDIVAQL
ncbi:MAG: AhpC/TSA family protein [Flavobacteriales bacterium]|nr:AhpC/TSA family protein [Flavobacteriales bacterium]